MMKINKWYNYLVFKNVPDNGIFICQPTDGVLDAEAWPIWSIVMINGKVVSQLPLYTAPGGAFAITDMIGWSKVQLVEWCQYEPQNNSHEESNNIVWLGENPIEKATEPEPYWFCVSLRTNIERRTATAIMAYYKVRGYAVGDGDQAEYLVIDQETREGDMLLAEMAFNAPGAVVWHQSKVCPICKNNGESICGHMYFEKAVVAAF